MKEKEPKSPIVVFATILFLSMFIVLPPLFRNLYPVEVEEPVEEVKENYVLTCSKVSVGEKLKIVSKVSYVKKIPKTNNILYMAYAANSDEGALINAEGVLTAAEELAIFRNVDGVIIKDQSSATVVLLKKEVVDNNSGNLELLNFMLPTIEEQEEYYINQGYDCTIN